jgi:hypothetical protein
MGVKAATNKLVELSDTIGAWQEMWGRVDVDLAKSTALEAKVAGLVASVSNRWSSGTGDKSEAYWGYSFARLRLEYFRDTRQHKQAFETALSIIGHPSCGDQECADSTVNAAIFQAYRLSESSRPDDHGSALTTRLLDAVAARKDSAALQRAGKRWSTPAKFDPHRPTHPGGRPLPLRARPFWEPAEVPVAARVEAEAAALLAELPSILQPDGRFKRVEGQSEYFQGRALGGAGKSGFMTNARDLCGVRQSGEEQCWQEFILYAAAASSTSGEKEARGRWNEAHCALVPQTCAALQHRQIIGSPNGLGHAGVAGKVSFIRLQAGQSIMAHTGGDNLRLTCHLGLRIPPTVGASGAYIEVGGERRGWARGKVTIIDDSFIHWVNNTSDEDRYILLFHAWHPDVVDGLGLADEEGAHVRKEQELGREEAKETEKQQAKQAKQTKETKSKAKKQPASDPEKNILEPEEPVGHGDGIVGAAGACLAAIAAAALLAKLKLADTAVPVASPGSSKGAAARGKDKPGSSKAKNPKKTKAK